MAIRANDRIAAMLPFGGMPAASLSLPGDMK